MDSLGAAEKDQVQLDIPPATISSMAAQLPRANLSLIMTPRKLLPATATSITGSRPSFSANLVIGDAALNHAFPHITTKPGIATQDSTVTLDELLPSQQVANSWVLVFSSGEADGIIMSQGRMHDIELVINPLSKVQAGMHTGAAAAVATSSDNKAAPTSPSWVNLLV